MKKYLLLTVVPLIAWAGTAAVRADEAGVMLHRTDTFRTLSQMAPVATYTPPSAWAPTAPPSGASWSEMTVAALPASDGAPLATAALLEPSVPNQASWWREVLLFIGCGVAGLAFVARRIWAQRTRVRPQWLTTQWLAPAPQAPEVVQAWRLSRFEELPEDVWGDLVPATGLGMPVRTRAVRRDRWSPARGTAFRRSGWSRGAGMQA